MAHCLILLAQGSKPKNNNNDNNNNKGGSSYECKTCNKSFHSFQALGGHRASHKKPKLSIAIPDHPAKKSSVFFSLLNDDDYNHHQQQQYNHPFNEEIALSLQISNGATSNAITNNSSSSNNNKAKVHECGICGAEFSSGQALGGHMRRHRPIGGTPTSISSPSQHVSIVDVNPNNYTSGDQKGIRNFLSLDLNLPVPEDDQHHKHHHHDSTSFVFPSNEKTLVFSASSLVDCHY